MINANTTAANTQELVSKAPGKVILSGEHSVVYGADAVAMAVTEYTHVTFSPVSQSKVINTIFSGISSSVIYPINALSKLKHRLDERFEQFTQGTVPVQQILNHPNDLVMYSLMSLLHQLPSRKTLQQFAPESGVLKSHSSIPTGAGMGSSASAIAATLVLYEHILGKPLSSAQRFDMVKFCERLQHGKGSAIDAATVTLGGLIRIVDGIPQRLSTDENISRTPSLNDWYWLHTGTPQASTGECVQQVRQRHSSNTRLWADFQDVTNDVIDCLQNGNSPLASIRENHRLLTGIGVVPETTQQLISLIEAHGGAAKISGAGSIRGEKAGMVLAHIPNCTHEELLNIANTKFGNYIQASKPLHMDHQGARFISQQP